MENKKQNRKDSGIGISIEFWRNSDWNSAPVDDFGSDVRWRPVDQVPQFQYVGQVFDGDLIEDGRSEIDLLAANLGHVPVFAGEDVLSGERPAAIHFTREYVRLERQHQKILVIVTQNDDVGNELVLAVGDLR